MIIPKTFISIVHGFLAILLLVSCEGFSVSDEASLPETSELEPYEGGPLLGLASASNACGAHPYPFTGSVHVVIVQLNEPGWLDQSPACGLNIKDNILHDVEIATSWLKMQAPAEAKLQFSASPTYLQLTTTTKLKNCSGGSDCMRAAFKTIAESAKQAGLLAEASLPTLENTFKHYNGKDYDKVIVLFMDPQVAVLTARPFASKPCSHSEFGPVAYFYYACETAYYDTIAHEILHIFGAFDEYEDQCAKDGCKPNCSDMAYFSCLENKNCETCSFAHDPHCIMRSGSAKNPLDICTDTRVQVGWGGGPCLEKSDGTYCGSELATGGLGAAQLASCAGQTLSSVATCKVSCIASGSGHSTCCGDAACQSGESNANCAVDCPTSTCPNGVCGPNEVCTDGQSNTCQADCCLAAPTLIKPAETASVTVNQSVTFSWSGPSKAVRHHFVVCRDTALTNCVENQQPAPGTTSLTLSPASWGPGTYYWTLRAIPADENIGAGFWSLPRKLIVTAGTPSPKCGDGACNADAGEACDNCASDCCLPAPTLLAPGDGETFVEGTGIPFDWTDVPGANRYWLWWCLGPDPSTNCDHDEAIFQSSKSISSIPVGTWYWTVRAIPVVETGWGKWAPFRQVVVTSKAANCTPNCVSKQCGQNGCGGLCGSCSGSSSCGAAGTCVPTCKPDCTGKACGPDGCTGSCGVCQLSPIVEASPSQVVHGGLVIQNGYGFTPNSTVELWFTYPNGGTAMLEKSTDGSGNYLHSWNVPLDAQLGTFHYYAVDVTTDTQSNTVDYTVVSNTPVCECSTGTCCDGCNFRSAATKCGTSPASWEYDCTAGCTGKQKRRPAYAYCSGNQPACDSSNLKTEGAWETVNTCKYNEVCDTNGFASWCAYDAWCQQEYQDSQPAYIYGNTSICESIILGTEATGWPHTCVGPTDTVDSWNPFTVLAYIENVYVSFQFSADIYRNGVLAWSTKTKWETPDTPGGWSYYGFYFEEQAAHPGLTEVYIYLDTGNGPQFLDSVSVEATNEEAACVSSPSLCDDGNPCTSDVCDQVTGCHSTPVSVPCSDGNACTVGDMCSNGLCVPGPGLSCDDGNVCTDDACSPTSGCSNESNFAPCDDENTCTTSDSCSGGSCVGSVLPSCADADGDGDGFSVAQGDCNDANQDFYPGAPELCDGKDNDCDGQADAGECGAPGINSTEPCGTCGMRTLTCDSNCAWSAGSCEEAGTCSPGMSENCANACGTGVKTCEGSCTWGACVGGSSGECVSGTMAVTECGKCGTQTSTCSPTCTWGQPSLCVGEGSCSPGAVVPCTNEYGDGDQACGPQCTWSTCSAGPSIIFSEDLSKVLVELDRFSLIDGSALADVETSGELCVQWWAKGQPFHNLTAPVEDSDGDGWVEVPLPVLPVGSTPFIGCAVGPLLPARFSLLRCGASNKPDGGWMNYGTAPGDPRVGAFAWQGQADYSEGCQCTTGLAVSFDGSNYWASGSATSNATCGATADPGSLIGNGEFNDTSDDLNAYANWLEWSSWTETNKTGLAPQTLSCEYDAGNGFEDAPSAKCTSAASPVAEDWHVLFSQRIESIPGGKLYRLRYCLRGSVPGQQVVVHLQEPEGPVNYIGPTWRTLTADQWDCFAEEKYFSVTISPAKLAFGLGFASAGPVWIDRVSLSPVCPASPTCQPFSMTIPATAPTQLEWWTLDGTKLSPTTVGTGGATVASPSGACAGTVIWQGAYTPAEVLGTCTLCGETVSKPMCWLPKGGWGCANNGDCK